jgi:1-acyl-sn-glycerol-3-phosphate acyltransferase
MMYPIAYCLPPKKVWATVYRPLTKLLLFCLENIVRIKYEVKNYGNIPQGPFIIGCNHQSTWETFIFSVLFNELAIVVKKELLKKPIAGLYFRKLGCIPVDRTSPVAAIKTLLKHGKIASQSGRSILIFPNGTRASSGDDVEYKSGIFALYKTLEIPVIPVKIDSGRYWPNRTLKKIPGVITLNFRKIIPIGASKKDFFLKFEVEMND